MNCDLACWRALGILLLATGTCAGSSALAVMPPTETCSTAETAQQDTTALRVEIENYGPIAAELDAARQALLDSARGRRLQRRGWDPAAVQYVDPKHKAGAREGMIPPPPGRFQVGFSNDERANKELIAKARLSKPGQVQTRIRRREPLPDDDDFRTAIEILEQDPALGAALRNDVLMPSPGMPLVIETGQGAQRAGRILAILLLGPIPDRQDRVAEIVGVNLSTREVIRYPDGSPPGAELSPGGRVCGWQQAPDQSSTDQGLAGQALVSVFAGPTLLWRFVLLRPSISSGTRGSGVELRYVEYRGKRILNRAHTPILTAKYDEDRNGPYRDWMYAENPFNVPVPSTAPILLTPPPVRTINDDGKDQGNYTGVAISVEGDEVVVQSALESSWYRYTSQWRLKADGTLRPRWGFTAVKNPAVCVRHVHHAYWRLDFDIGGAGRNDVLQRVGGSDPPQFEPIRQEVKLFRTAESRWRVLNSRAGGGVEIIPGPNDLTAQGDPYAKGDVWVLRYHDNEIDDGYDEVVDPNGPQLDRFVDGERVGGKDLVFWYAGHLVHDVGDEDLDLGEYVGPEIHPLP
jgi:hypothetical protein